MTGYAENHTSDCYRMFNPATSQVFISCDEAYEICDKAQYNEATTWE